MLAFFPRKSGLYSFLKTGVTLVKNLSEEKLEELRRLLTAACRESTFEQSN